MALRQQSIDSVSRQSTGVFEDDTEEVLASPMTALTVVAEQPTDASLISSRLLGYVHSLGSDGPLDVSTVEYDLMSLPTFDSSNQRYLQRILSNDGLEVASQQVGPPRVSAICRPQ